MKIIISQISESGHESTITNGKCVYVCRTISLTNKTLSLHANIPMKWIVTRCWLPSNIVVKHGSAWRLGSLDQHDSPCRYFFINTKIAILQCENQFVLTSQENYNKQWCFPFNIMLNILSDNVGFLRKIQFGSHV
jgi:hypothetical protein